MRSGAALGPSVRDEFPIFTANSRRTPTGVLPLVYLDSAATAQKPLAVIRAMQGFLEHDYGTIHRGAYALSVKSSQMYEDARAQVASLVSPLARPDEVVFVRGSTEGLNLLANGIAERFLDDKSRIVTTVAEHHANMVPWQQAALRKDCELAYIPLRGKRGVDLALDLDEARKLITPNTRVVSLAHVGNVLGQVNPIAEIVKMAKAVGALVVLDCAQSIASFEDDLFALGADAVVFSAHKMYGPSGIGAVVARRQLLRDIPPLLFGGGMICNVTLEESTWAEPPAKFEAGTPPIVEAMGFAAATTWLLNLGRARVHEHAARLASKFAEGLVSIPGIEIFSPGTGQETVISFRHAQVHAHDLATILDTRNVAMRAGHHCAWPLVRILGVDALVRASFAAYSNELDVELALGAIRDAAAVL